MFAMKCSQVLPKQELMDGLRRIGVYRRVRSLWSTAKDSSNVTKLLQRRHFVTRPNITVAACSDGGFLQTEASSTSEISASSFLMDVLNSKVYDVVSETPLHCAHNMSEAIGNTVLLKREDLQPVFSFKLRGAYNKIANLSPEQLRKGVIACSAGNHAQGVAYSAKHLNISSKIFMPVTTPSIKVDSARRLGAETVLFGNSLEEAMEACLDSAEREQRNMIHPFNDPLVIAGQGTIALELLKQSHAEKIDAIFICCGGGGLLAGIGGVVKSVAPHIKIIGVEAADAPGMTESLRAGKVVELDTVGTFAEGAAVRTIGSHTFRICSKVVDEMVVCSTDEICGAIKTGFTDLRVVLEPAGALAIAGLKKYSEKNKTKGKTYVAVCSGANMDFDRLRFVSERADTTEHLISVIIPEKPGTFRIMHDMIAPREVTEFSYRLSEPWDNEGALACVMMSFRSCSSKDVEEVMNRLRANYCVLDLQDNEMAKVHGRHLVGGRSVMAQNEVLYRFGFPHRPGALKQFLYSLSDNWNVSLFHYRNHGSDVGRVLVGIQVPPETMDEFQKFLRAMSSLSYTHIEETNNPVYRQFLSKIL